MLWLSGVHLTGKEACQVGGIIYIAHDDRTVGPSVPAAGALLSLPTVLPEVKPSSALLRHDG